jgi:hypothetical protein
MGVGYLALNRALTINGLPLLLALGDEVSIGRSSLHLRHLASAQTRICHETSAFLSHGAHKPCAENSKTNLIVGHFSWRTTLARSVCAV